MPLFGAGNRTGQAVPMTSGDSIQVDPALKVCRTMSVAERAVRRSDIRPAQEEFRDDAHDHRV
jgi:hypothetical protein